KLAEETIKHIKGNNTKIMLAGSNINKLEVVKKELQTWNPEVEYFIYQINALEYDKHQTLFDFTIETLGGLDTFLVAHGTLPDNEKIRKDAAETIKEFNINCLSV